MKSFVLASLFFMNSLWASDMRTSLSIVAIVQSKAISERRVLLDTIIENPKTYSSKLSPEAASRALQRVIDQHIVDEENRIVGQRGAAQSQIQSRFNQIKSEMASLWTKFTTEFDTNETEVKSIIAQQLALSQALTDKLKSIQDSPNMKLGASKKSSEKALQDWLTQLRLRYGVRYMTTKPWPEKKEGNK